MQDLSCLGRCSLTVALPMLESLGVQAVPLPTAVLSTHTGGFGHPAAVDLTAFMQEAIFHYRSLDLRFDAVVTGYMASIQQADRVTKQQNFILRKPGSWKSKINILPNLVPSESSCSES